MLERIAGIIREQLNLDNVEITEETSFKDDLDADSLDLFELVMALLITCLAYMEISP